MYIMIIRIIISQNTTTRMIHPRDKSACQELYSRRNIHPWMDLACNRSLRVYYDKTPNSTARDSLIFFFMAPNVGRRITRKRLYVYYVFCISREKESFVLCALKVVCHRTIRWHCKETFNILENECWYIIEKLRINFYFVY